jgi:hypothetical protein
MKSKISTPASEGRSERVTENAPGSSRQRNFLQSPRPP